MVMQRERLCALLRYRQRRYAFSVRGSAAGVPVPAQACNAVAPAFFASTPTARRCMWFSERSASACYRRAAVARGPVQTAR